MICNKNDYVTICGNDLHIKILGRFDLAATLDCGQAFRWYFSDEKWHGVAHSKYLSLYQDGNTLVLENCSINDFNEIWSNYFDLKRDYGEILSAVSGNETLRKICSYAGGIKLIKQEPWEALCSFIISQNNNIPRIKGIIERLCDNFGTPVSGSMNDFPSAEKLSALSIDDLAVLRSGFRAKYIIDAAQKVASGNIDLDSLSAIPLADARAELMRIKGVGPKVADCTLLFGCGRIECFPVDVWIRRAMNTLFNGELPDSAKPYAGIIQQYIFHYARMTKLKTE